MCYPSFLPSLLICLAPSLTLLLLPLVVLMDDDNRYGPDTYMGENLYNLLNRLSRMSDEQVAAVHPAHTAATIRALLPRFHYFKQVQTPPPPLHRLPF